MKRLSAVDSSDAIIETATTSCKRNACIHCMHHRNARCGEKRPDAGANRQPIAPGTTYPLRASSSQAHPPMAEASIFLSGLFEAFV